MALRLFHTPYGLIALGVVQMNPERRLIPEDLLPAGAPHLLQEIVGSLPPAVQKFRCHLQILLLSRRFIKLHKGKLDLLMAGNSSLQWLPVERVHNMVRHAAAKLQELPLACHLVIGDACLYQVSGTVKLMAFPQICKLPSLFPDLEIGVKVAVLHLSPGKEADHLVHLSLQLLIRM